MIRLLPQKRFGPIGVDLGTRSVKLVQFTADHSRLIDAARWDLPLDGAESPEPQRIIDTIRRAREGRAFRGSDAVLCLTEGQLAVQNIRVPKTEPDAMQRKVQQEMAGRLPYGVEEAEIRHIDAADVRQGDTMLREMIVFACRRTVIEQTLEIVEGAGLRPVVVDVEPAALLRCYLRQLRREEDLSQRTMFVEAGFSHTAVVISQGDDVLFVKYIAIGGRHFDEAVARLLKMPLADASSIRRQNGDRRSDQQDPDVTRSVAEAVRPVLDRLAGELSMCVRYHSVTFRGQPLSQVVLGGGEASTLLLEALGQRLNVSCALSDPLRGLQSASLPGRKGQWDVATGLALRELN